MMIMIHYSDDDHDCDDDHDDDSDDHDDDNQGSNDDDHNDCDHDGHHSHKCDALSLYLYVFSDWRNDHLQIREGEAFPPTSNLLKS